MKIRANLKTLASWSLVALLLGPGVAHAEEEAVSGPGEVVAQADGDAPAARRRPGTGIEEITVTARKREENLQDTPVSVSAFSAQDLVDNGVSRVDDIGRFTPNLTFDQAANGQNDARLQVRGIGNGDPITTRDPGVGLYVDGVYLARAQGGLLGLVDIERVEVLRGPQGTLFGRNTIGGAVNLVTQKPSDEFESRARVRFGNYNLVDSKLMVNVPLLPERAAMRVSLQTTNREGYSKNRLTGQETDDRRMLAARVALRINATENIELNLSAEQTRSHSAGRGAECRATPENLNIAPLIQGLMDARFSPQPNCMANEFDGNELKFNSGVKGKDNLDTWGATAALDWDLETMAFKSTTSWRRQEPESRDDFTFSAAVDPSQSPPFGLDQVVGQVITKGEQFDQVSQEFNLSGAALDGGLQWTAGLFGFYEKTNPGVTMQLVSFDTFCNLLTVVFPPGAPETMSVCGGSNISSLPRTRTLALAGYGQATYDVSDRLHLTAGLRYSVESKTFSGRQRNFVAFDPTFANLDLSTVDALAPGTPDCNICGGRETSERYSKWTPLLTVAFDTSDDSMVYATYSRGFKSGGFNGRPNANVPASLLPFDQEVLTNYEIGLKSTWFDNRLIANVSAFYGLYDDIQQTILSASAGGDFASRVANAGEAVIRGAEVELRATPLPGLDLTAGLGFVDAEYREFNDMVEDLANAVSGQPTESIPVNRRSEEFANTPSFTATLSAAYTLYEVGALGDVTTRINWYHQDDVNYGPSSDTLNQGKYGLLGAQINFALPDGKTEIALWGENLLDRRYVNSGINFERGFAASFAFFGAPRMYGVEIRRSF